MIIFQILTTIGLITAIVVLIVKTIIQSYNTLFFLLGFLFFFVTIINDFLYYNQIIITEDMAPTGIFVLIISQAIILTINYNKTYNNTIKLSDEIRYKSHELKQNNDKLLKQNHIMFVNCAQGKGIKFIREDLKFFAKTHINFKNGNFFKTVILSNADKLTIDAQSALRRCIEQFSHTTRFFIIVEDKYKLLKPILSRFSEIYVPLPLHNSIPINLHHYNINPEISAKLYTSLKRTLVNLDNPSILYEVSQKLYDKGITGLDLINYISKSYKNNSFKFK